MNPASQILIATGNVVALGIAAYSLYKECIYKCAYLPHLTTVNELFVAFDSSFIIVFLSFLFFSIVAGMVMAKVSNSE